MARECLNDLCVYENNKRCTLPEISVNAAGLCADMLFVNIDEDYLAAKKVKILKEFDEALNEIHYADNG